MMSDALLPGPPVAGSAILLLMIFKVSFSFVVVETVAISEKSPLLSVTLSPAALTVKGTLIGMVK